MTARSNSCHSNSVMMYRTVSHRQSRDARFAACTALITCCCHSTHVADCSLQTPPAAPPVRAYSSITKKHSSAHYFPEQSRQTTWQRQERTDLCAK